MMRHIMNHIILHYDGGRTTKDSHMNVIKVMDNPRSVIPRGAASETGYIHKLSLTSFCWDHRLKFHLRCKLRVTRTEEPSRFQDHHLKLESISKKLLSKENSHWCHLLTLGHFPCDVSLDQSIVEIGLSNGQFCHWCWGWVDNGHHLQCWRLLTHAVMTCYWIRMRSNMKRSWRIKLKLLNTYQYSLRFRGE